MRRFVTSLLTTLAIVAASVALGAHIANLAAFDRGRPARVLAAMLDTSAGKSLAADALTAQVERVVPTLTHARAEAIGRGVVNDPELPAALKAAGKSRGTSAEPSLSAAMTTAITRADPRAGAAYTRQLRKQDPVTSPAASLSFVPAVAGAALARTHEVLTAAAELGTKAALLLLSAALLLGPGRDRVLRRIGRWGLGAGIVQVLIWLVAPLVLARMDGRWPVVVAAGLKASGAGLLQVFMLVTFGGLLVLVLGWVASFLSPVSGDADTPWVLRRAASKLARDRAQDRSARRRTSVPGTGRSSYDPEPDSGPDSGPDLGPDLGPGLGYSTGRGAGDGNLRSGVAEEQHRQPRGRLDPSR